MPRGGMNCAVAVCNNSSGKCKNVSFHRFPRCQKTRKIWIETCKRKDNFNPNTSYVCSEHFGTDDFERDFKSEFGLSKAKPLLKEGSIPHKKLFPRYISENVREIIMDKSNMDHKSDALTTSQDPLMDTIKIEPEAFLEMKIKEECLTADNNLESDMPSNVLDYPAVFFKTEIKEELDENFDNASLQQNSAQQPKTETIFIHEYVKEEHEYNILDYCTEEADFKRTNVCNPDYESKEYTDSHGVDNILRYYNTTQNTNGKSTSLFDGNIPSCSYKEKEPAGKKKNKHSKTICNRWSNNEKHILKENCSNIGSDIQRIKIFTCDVCQKTFTRLDLIKGHINTVHNKIKKHTCSECSKKFSRLTSLKIHVKTFHQRIRNFGCGDCGKMFFDKSKLKNHINNIHRGIQEYSCDVCRKQFSQLCNLKDHIYVHFKHESFECEFCDKVFPKPSSLKRHIKSYHKGTKDFACNACDRKFSYLSLLTNHFNRVHKGIKAYTCEICGKAFSQPQHLKTHVNGVHKKLKIFSCTLCHKSFSTKGTLNNHVNAIHRRKKFECEKCKKNYSGLYILRRHVRSFHTDSAVDTDFK